MTKISTPRITLYAIGCALLAFVVVYISTNLNKSDQNSKAAKSTTFHSVKSDKEEVDQKQGRKLTVGKFKEQSGSADPIELADRLLNERKKLSELYTGTQLLDEQIRFNGRVVERLSGTALLRYFKGIYDIGAGKDFDLTISIAIAKAFGSNTVKQSLDWLGENNDPAFMMRIAYFAGDAYYGDDFVAIMSRFENPTAQAKFLSGKCSQIAVSDLPGAIKTFIANKPSSVDFSEMKGVFNLNRPDADFRSANDLIPSDAKSVASDVRAALFRRWAEYAPREVADLIVSGDNRIYLKHLSPVLHQWYETNPEDALSWVSSMTAGESKDLGLQSLIEPMVQNKPVVAWNTAMQINDEAKRDTILKRVYSEWLKCDPTAAESAKSQFMAADK